MKKVCIIDYGSGNVTSVKNALEYLGVSTSVSNSKSIINNSSHIILPGVGSYATTLQKLKKKVDLNFLEKQVLEKGKFFLGICVGMQILSTTGNEFVESKGLNWIPGTVKKINSKNLILPHVGWNNLRIKAKNPLVEKNKILNNFYFVHSYKFTCKNKKNIIAQVKYGEIFDAVIQKDNIFGVQFHPEKCLKNGLSILKQFSLIN